jgi:ABC-type sugar transport system ATPase subunit
MTLFNNMAFGLQLAKKKKDFISETVGRTAKALGLDHMLERKPSALSGGQRQRVALGRAIVRSPKVFLFDEPLSNLDAKMRVQMRSEISKLHAQLGNTMIYVTHDQVEAMTMGDRICVMRDGLIMQVADPLTLYRQPENLFVAGFIGSPPMNLVRLRVERGEVDLGGAKLRTPRVDLAEVVLGIRPHAIELVEGAGVAARVAAVERLGTQTLVHCEVGAAQLLVAREGNLDVAVDRHVRLRLPPAALHWFDAHSGARIESVAGERGD